MVYPKFVVTKFVSSTTVAALEKILVMLPVCGPVYDPDMSDGLNIFIFYPIHVYDRSPDDWAKSIVKTSPWDAVAKFEIPYSGLVLTA